jgi:hypothetical protein
MHNFGDNETSDGGDSEDDKFWDCDETKHPTLSIHCLAILACLPRTFKDKTTSDDGPDCPSDDNTVASLLIQHWNYPPFGIQVQRHPLSTIHCLISSALVHKL